MCLDGGSDSLDSVGHHDLARSSFDYHTWMVFRSPDWVTCPRHRSPEVFYEHQVLRRGIHAGKKNSSAVGSFGKAGANLTEVAADCRRLAGKKVQILERYAPEQVDIVDAIVKHWVIEPTTPSITLTGAPEPGGMDITNEPPSGDTEGLVSANAGVEAWLTAFFVVFDKIANSASGLPHPEKRSRRETCYRRLGDKRAERIEILRLYIREFPFNSA
jgi:hypothetical protein